MSDLMTVILEDTFAPPEDHQERTLRIRQFIDEELQLLFHEQPHRGLRHVFCDARRGSMRAVRRAEGVVHIDVAQFGQRLGKSGVVRLLFRMETDILQQGHVARLHVGDDFFRDRPNDLVAEGDRVIDELVQVIRHRPQRIFRHGLALRPAEVRHEDNLRPFLPQQCDRGQRFADAGVVSNVDFPLALLGGHVEIDTHQDTLALDLQIADGKLHGIIGRATRASGRSGCCSPTHCRTSRRS